MDVFGCGNRGSKLFRVHRGTLLRIFAVIDSVFCFFYTLKTFEFEIKNEPID